MQSDYSGKNALKFRKVDTSVQSHFVGLARCAFSSAAYLGMERSDSRRAANDARACRVEAQTEPMRTYAMPPCCAAGTAIGEGPSCASAERYT